MELDQDGLLREKDLTSGICNKLKILAHTTEAAWQHGIRLLFNLDLILSDCLRFYYLHITEQLGHVAKHSPYLSGDDSFFVPTQAATGLGRDYVDMLVMFGSQPFDFDLILVTTRPGHQQYSDRILEHKAPNLNMLNSINACLRRLEANLSLMIAPKSSFKVILMRPDSRKDNHLSPVDLRKFSETTYSSFKGEMYLRPGLGFFGPLSHGSSLPTLLHELFSAAKNHTEGRMGTIQHLPPGFVGVEHSNIHAQAAFAPEYAQSVTSNENPNQKLNVNMYGFTHASSLYQLLRQARATFDSQHIYLPSAEIDRLWQQEWSEIMSQIDSGHPASIATLLPYQPKNWAAPASMTSPEADSPWSETDGLPPPYALSPGVYQLRLEAATRLSPSPS